MTCIPKDILKFEIYAIVSLVVIVATGCAVNRGNCWRTCTQQQEVNFNDRESTAASAQPAISGLLTQYQLAPTSHVCRSEEGPIPSQLKTEQKVVHSVKTSWHSVLEQISHDDTSNQPTRSLGVDNQEPSVTGKVAAKISHKVPIGQPKQLTDHTLIVDPLEQLKSAQTNRVLDSTDSVQVSSSARSQSTDSDFAVSKQQSSRRKSKSSASQPAETSKSIDAAVVAAPNQTQSQRRSQNKSLDKAQTDSRSLSQKGSDPLREGHEKSIIIASPPKGLLPSEIGSNSLDIVKADSPTEIKSTAMSTTNRTDGRSIEISNLPHDKSVVGSLAGPSFLVAEAPTFSNKQNNDTQQISSGLPPRQEPQEQYYQQQQETRPLEMELRDRGWNTGLIVNRDRATRAYQILDDQKQARLAESNLDTPTNYYHSMPQLGQNTSRNDLPTRPAPESRAVGHRPDSIDRRWESPLTVERDHSVYSDLLFGRSNSPPPQRTNINLIATPDNKPTWIPPLVSVDKNTSAQRTLPGEDSQAPANKPNSNDFRLEPLPIQSIPIEQLPPLQPTERYTERIPISETAR